MKKHILFFSLILFAGQTVRSQSLTTVTGLRLYEHHSKSIAGPKGADGFQSGYDFVKRDYVNSFDDSTFGPHTDGTDTTIDMVEHNGIYGNGGNGGLLGFTSGVSSIWSGDIKGNGTTKWMEAPAGFDYSKVAMVTELKAAYTAAAATQAITTVKNNTVYIGRIRNTELYVAMRCYNLSNGGSSGDTYFDFDYKYGVWTTGVNDVKNMTALSVYPNPATKHVTLGNTLHEPVRAKVITLAGVEVKSISLQGGEIKTLDASDMASGMYLVVCTKTNGSSHIQKFIKQ